MMKSTSIHNLNADRGLELFQKFLYLFLNWVNNLFPYFNTDKRINIKNFDNKDWEREFKNTYETSSVGRRLSDIFWRTLPWNKIQEELGEMHIFDTGCGSGNYGLMINDASGGGVSSYTGVDHKEKANWKETMEKHSNFKLIKMDSGKINELIPEKTNLFITQSAIEHFDEDLEYFERIRDFIEKSDKPIIQIHNFPGKAILSLYLFHGVRQYTPRTISKITRLFGNESKFYLYGLGGNAGKKLQFKYFTWPLLILRKKKGKDWPKDSLRYNEEVKKAIGKDVANPSKSPIFWVLIIYSNPKRKIW